MNDFDMGFLTALTSFGVGKSATGLPSIDKLTFVNYAYYGVDIGERAMYLNATSYARVFSSTSQRGGIVMLGAYQLEDWDDETGETPRAMFRITTDNKVIFEDEITAFFPSNIPEKVKAFSYQSSFIIEAKRLNLTDGMLLQLYEAMLISYR